MRRSVCIIVAQQNSEVVRNRLDGVEKEPDPTQMLEYEYTVDEDNVLEWVSTQWLTFAAENQARGLQPELILGHSLWEYVSGAETRHLYERLFDRVRELQAPVSVPFRCDAPELRRFMRLTIEPAEDCSLRIVVQLVREEERERVALLDVGVGRDEAFLSMCSWCRRVLAAPDQWEEVEIAIQLLGLFERDSLPEISHGVCPDCYARVMGEVDGVAS